MKAYETCKPVLLEQVQFKPVIVLERKERWRMAPLWRLEQEGRQPSELTSVLQGVCLGASDNACSLKKEGEKL